MSPISRSLPLENIKEGTPAARETKYKTLEKNAEHRFLTKAKGTEVSLSDNTLSMLHKG